MKLVVPELALIHVLVWHHQLSSYSLVVAPFTLKFAAVGPNHSALAIPLIVPPLSFEIGVLVLIENFIHLLEYHRALTTPLSVFEEASIVVTTSVIDHTISTEASFLKIAVQILLLLVRVLSILEQVTN